MPSHLLARFPMPIFLGCVAVAAIAGCGSNNEVAEPHGAGGESSDGGTGNTAAGGSAATTTGGAGGIAPTGGAGNTPTGGAGNAPSGGTSGTGGTGGTPTTGGSGGTVPTGGAGGTAPVFDAGTDPARNRVQPGTVCDRLSTVQCAGEAACCSAPGRTFDQCKAEIQTACMNEVYLDAVSLNPVTGYSVDAAETAFTEFERLASQCDPTIAAWGSSVQGLRGITLGTVPAAGTCTPPNVADPPQIAAALASCQNAATHACLPSLLPPWTCAPRGQAGGPCFTDLNCADGLHCPNPNFAFPGIGGVTCAARKPDGQPCSLPNECVSLMCRGGSCVPADQQTAYCLQTN